MDHPELSAQVFPSSSKSTTSDCAMLKLQPFQLAVPVVFDTFLVLFFTTVPGIWRCFPLLWKCVFLNDSTTQPWGRFHNPAVVCSYYFQFQTLKALSSQGAGHVHGSVPHWVYCFDLSGTLYRWELPLTSSVWHSYFQQVTRHAAPRVLHLTTTTSDSHPVTLLSK